jgi:hypothetical protein
MRSRQSTPPKQWLNPPHGLGIRLRRSRYTCAILITKASVLGSLKRSLVLLLLVSLPLQAQAAAWMACHASFQSVGSGKALEQSVHHHSEAHTADGHSAHVAIASDATASDATASDAITAGFTATGFTATGSAASQASGCALCAASCFMAHGLPAAVQHTFTQAEFRTLIPGPQLHFASVVLEGLLRPPRS